MNLMEQLLTVRQLYKDTAAYADQSVTFSGWVRNLRASKAFGFIMLSDGTFFTPVQVVYQYHMSTKPNSYNRQKMSEPDNSDYH